MRFLISYNYPFHRFGYGGGHQLVRGLSTHLAKEGHEVHVCCAGSDELGIAGLDAPVKYHFSGSDTRWSWLQVALQTVRLARRLRPDWVCCFTSEAVLVVPACNILKIPAMIFLASPELPDFRFYGWKTIRKVRYRWRNFLQYLGTRGARLCTTCSDFSTREARKNWRIPGRKLATVGVGIDDVYLQAVSTSKAAPSMSGNRLAPRFISVGRITLPQKPLHLVAAALAALPVPWHSWTIVGTGEDEEAFRARLRELDILDRTFFLGTQTPAQIAELMQEDDLALLPSNYESFFITPYEAAARGNIVVTNDVADVGAYFAGSPSVVVAESATPQAYRDAILYALENFSALSSHAEATAARVKNDYNWERIAERFLQALRKSRSGPRT